VAPSPLAHETVRLLPEILFHTTDRKVKNNLKLQSRQSWYGGHMYRVVFAALSALILGGCAGQTPPTANFAGGGQAIGLQSAAVNGDPRSSMATATLAQIAVRRVLQGGQS